MFLVETKIAVKAKDCVRLVESEIILQVDLCPTARDVAVNARLTISVRQVMRIS